MILDVLDKLTTFTPAEVMEALQSTYWQVQVDDLDINDPYDVAALGTEMYGQTVVFPVVMSLKGKSITASGEAVRFDLHAEHWWTGLFLITKKEFGCRGMAFAEGYPDTRILRWWPSKIGLDQVLERLAESDNRLAQPKSKVRLVPDLPAMMRLPVAALSEQEVRRWHNGSVYLWAKELFPPAIRKRVRFLPNEFPAPSLKSTSSF